MSSKKLIAFAYFPLLVGNGVGAAEIGSTDINISADVTAETCQRVTSGLEDMDISLPSLTISDVKDMKAKNTFKSISLTKDNVIDFSCAAGKSAKFSFMTATSQMCSITIGGTSTYQCSQGNDSILLLPLINFKRIDDSNGSFYPSSTVNKEVHSVKLVNNIATIQTPRVLIYPNHKVEPKPGLARSNFILKIWSE